MGNPEVIGSSVGLVLGNAPAVTTQDYVGFPQQRFEPVQGLIVDLE
jgi:hypothetical protein